MKHLLVEGVCVHVGVGAGGAEVAWRKVVEMLQQAEAGRCCPDGDDGTCWSQCGVREIGTTQQCPISVSSAGCAFRSQRLRPDSSALSLLDLYQQPTATM